jgi:hypothetical protein
MYIDNLAALNKLQTSRMSIYRHIESATENYAKKVLPDRGPKPYSSGGDGLISIFLGKEGVVRTILKMTPDDMWERQRERDKLTYFKKDELDAHIDAELKAHGLAREIEISPEVASFLYLTFIENAGKFSQALAKWDGVYKSMFSTMGKIGMALFLPNPYSIGDAGVGVARHIGNMKRYGDEMHEILNGRNFMVERVIGRDGAYMLHEKDGRYFLQMQHVTRTYEMPPSDGRGRFGIKGHWEYKCNYGFDNSVDVNKLVDLAKKAVEKAVKVGGEPPKGGPSGQVQASHSQASRLTPTVHPSLEAASSPAI